MSSIADIAIGSVVTADDFNRIIATKLNVYDEAGEPQMMAYHAFIYRADGVLKSLQKRVTALGLAITKKTVENIARAEQVIGQYDALRAIIIKMKILNLRMLEMLNYYDKTSDLKITEAKIIMSKMEARELTTQYRQFLTSLQITYFSNVSKRMVFLADQIGYLKKLVRTYKIKQQAFKVEK